MTHITVRPMRRSGQWGGWATWDCTGCTGDDGDAGGGFEWSAAVAADEGRRHLFREHGIETRTFHRPAPYARGGLIDRNRAADPYDATVGTSETPAAPVMGAGDFPCCEAVRSPHTHSGPGWTTSYHEGTRS